MSDLASLEIKRADIDAVFAQLDDIEKLVGGMAYRDGKAVVGHITAIRETVGELLPGGHYGKCKCCDITVGRKEIGHIREVDCGEYCPDCVKEFASQPEAEPEWTTHTGGGPPKFAMGTAVDVKFRDGRVSYFAPFGEGMANLVYWNNLGVGSDIVAYRLSPAEKPDE